MCKICHIEGQGVVYLDSQKSLNKHTRDVHFCVFTCKSLHSWHLTILFFSQSVETVHIDISFLSCTDFQFFCVVLCFMVNCFPVCRLL